MIVSLLSCKRDVAKGGRLLIREQILEVSWLARFAIWTSRWGVWVARLIVIWIICWLLWWGLHFHPLAVDCRSIDENNNRNKKPSENESDTKKLEIESCSKLNQRFFTFNCSNPFSSSSNSLIFRCICCCAHKWEKKRRKGLILLEDE